MGFFDAIEKAVKHTANKFQDKLGDVKDSVSSKNSDAPGPRIGALFDPLSYIAPDAYKSVTTAIPDAVNKGLGPLNRKAHDIDPLTHYLRKEVPAFRKVTDWTGQKPGSAFGLIYGGVSVGGALSGGGSAAGEGGASSSSASTGAETGLDVSQYIEYANMLSGGGQQRQQPQQEDEALPIGQYQLQDYQNSYVPVTAMADGGVVPEPGGGWDVMLPNVATRPQPQARLRPTEATLNAGLDQAEQNLLPHLQQDFPGMAFERTRPPARGANGMMQLPDIPLEGDWDVQVPDNPRDAAAAAPAADVSSWAQLGRGAKAGWENIKKAFAGSELGFNNADPAVQALLIEGSNADYSQLEATRQAYADRTPEQVQAVNQKLFDKIGKYNARIEKLSPPEDAALWDKILFDTANSLTVAAPALAAGVATGGGVYVMIPAIGTGQYYASKADYLQKGLASERANTLAFVDGATEALTELIPGHTLFKRTGILKKALTTIGSDIPGEMVAAVIQNGTQNVAQLGNEPTDEQVLDAFKAGAQQAWDDKYRIAGSTALAGGVQAGVTRLALGRDGQQARPRATTPVPPAGAVPPVSAPSGAGQAPATAPTNSVSAGSSPARVAMYAPPEANGAATAVQVNEVSGEFATVTSLDEEGKPLMIDGEPATYQVPVATLRGPGFAPAKAPVTPVAKVTPPANSEAPANPAGVADAPTAEPVRDVQAQLADMNDPKTPRGGVFLSKANLTNLRQLKQLEGLTAGLPVARNWDYAGGLMVFPTEAARDAAIAARDSITGKDRQVQRQALTGKLTGSAVVSDTKPVGPGLAVQAKTPDGAVVRETLVAPESVSAAETALAAEQPGTVISVTTPQGVQEQRAAGVAADVASNPDEFVKWLGGRVQAVTEGGEDVTTVDVPGLYNDLKTNSKDLPKFSAEQKMQVRGHLQQLATHYREKYGKELPGYEPSDEDLLTPELVKEYESATAPKKNRLSAVLPPSQAPAAASAPVVPPVPAATGTAAAPANPKPAKPKVQTPRQQVEDSIKMLRTMEQPKEGRDRPDGLEQRAQNAVTFAAGLKTVLGTVSKRIPSDTLQRARSAIEAVRSLRDKSGEDFTNAIGTNHAKVTSKIQELIAAAEEVAAALPSPKVHAKLSKTKEPDASSEAQPATQQEATPAAAAAPKPASEAPAETPPADVSVDVDARPTIEVKPRRVVGNELISLLKTELGIDPETLKGGGLADRVRDLLPDFNREDSWINYLASLQSVFKDHPTLRTKIRNLGNRFVAAADNEIPAVTGKVIEALQDIKGQRLSPKAIDAVIEYMRYLRSFTKMRSTLDDMASSEEQDAADLREVMGDDSVLDARGRKQLNGGDPSAPRGWDLVESAPRSIRDKLSYGFQSAGAVFEGDGALAEILDRFYNQDTDASLHSLLDGWLQRADTVDDSNLEYLRTFVRQLRRRVPDVPVRFGDAVQNLGAFAKPPAAIAKAGGLFDTNSNTIQVRITDGDRTPTQTFKTLIHEAVHAATVYEMYARPNSPASSAIRDAYRQALKMASDRYGIDRVQNSLEYITGRLAEKPADFLDGMYGFENDREFVAEMFTNPLFQERLLDLGRDGKGKEVSIVRRILDQIIGAIYRALDLKNTSHAWLLRDSMAAGLQVMDAQVFSSLENQAHVETLITELQKIYPELDRTELRQRLVGTTSPTKPHYSSLVYSAGSEALAAAVPAGARQVDPSYASFSDEIPEGNLRMEDRLRGIVGESAVKATKRATGFMKSRQAEALRRGFLSTYTFDQLERRMARFFGGTAEAMNPLRRVMDVRRRRQTAANQLLERAQEHVNARWLSLSQEQSTQLGQMMIDSTIWQIDPRKPINEQLAKATKRRGFDARYGKIRHQWTALSTDQQEIYSAAAKYNEYSFNKLRRAAVDLALDGYSTTEITPAERSIIYSMKSPDELEQVVGHGKMIDLGDNNDGFLKTMRDVMKVTTIEGPYFTLRRSGNLVVQAEKEGQRAFNNEGDAASFAERINGMTPKNKAKYKQQGDQWVVDYKVDYVSFHKSRGEAEAEVEQLKAMGLAVNPVTHKNQAVVSSALTPALKELVTKASQRLPGNNEDKGRQAIVHAMENAFAVILAERAAIGSQLKRENVAGVKPHEMHLGFAERAHSFAWHYANLTTAKEEARTLTRLREYSRDPELGNVLDQATMYQRGQVVEEVERRLIQEAEDFGVSGALDSALAKVGFATYLATPSYAFINSMQNFTIAMPVIGARYGYGRTAKAFSRAMAAVAGPAFSKAIRGIASLPGRVTSYDVYKAVADAVEGNPRLAKWVQGDNSPVQQLVDLGVINASFTQELVDVAHGESLGMQKTLEWMRLVPQAAEMMNRVSTALAMLELTDGNVTKAADMVRLTQIDYASQNRPRAFKAFDKIKGGRALLMFKMYPQAMYHLIVSSMHDMVKGGEMTRGEAAKTLGGIVTSHTLAAGVLGGLMMEPVRMLVNSIASIFGDDDEPWDLDTGIRAWLAETFGDTWAARVVAKGLPNALGVDLSNRMGLAHLFFWDTPDWKDSKAIFEWVGQQTGPVVSFLAKGISGAYNALSRGDYFHAITSLIPIKMVRDISDGIELATEGMQTRTGTTVLPEEDFGAVDAAAKFLGFTPSEQADQQDKNQTRYNYRQWVQTRKEQIMAQVRNASSEAEKKDAYAAVRRFNERNPGASITAQSVQQSRRTAQQQAAEARGDRVKDQALRERLAY